MKNPLPASAAQIVPAAGLPAPYLQNRELSWLDFNERVLDQGADESVPLLQRLNFISIFWSNLQEFFMVRVGSLTDLSLVKKHIVDSKSNMTPSEQLHAIYARTRELYPAYERTYEQVRTLLHEVGITHVRPADLTEEQRAYLADYARVNVMPFLSPQIINARHPFPHLENGAIYIVVRLDEEADNAPAKKHKKDKKKGKKDKAAKAAVKAAEQSQNVGAEGTMLGLIPLPRQCERVVALPGDGMQFILLEHVVEMVADKVFSMYTVKHTNIICVTRNADIDASESTDENDEDYREHMKRILKKRARLAPVRLETERELSDTVESLLLDKLNLKKHQVYTTSVPLDLSFTWGIEKHLPEKKRAALTYAPFTPQWPACLDRTRPVMDQVMEGDVLLSYPYESMDPFVQLLREASRDPRVISIKITLYRLARQSHLAEALIDAAEAGKEVTALFELRARFDESNNIEWSQRFEEAGCNVIYGFRDYKVHSKICCITLQTDNGLTHITQLGTGNYNEKTAKLYTDLSLITTSPSIGRDAMEFFRNMALENVSDNYDVLWVAPLQVKPLILKNIDEQIELAHSGKPCGLFFKANSVTDKDIIDKIAEASQAGVKTTMLVRGISCLVPGVEGYTENVRVVSIVGRMLEHSRIYGFGAHDDMKIYLASADLMTRNMEKRVEIAWPILNEALRDRIISYIDISLTDTAKLRELLPNRSYTPLGFFAQVRSDGKVVRFDSQAHFMEESQRRLRKAAEAAVEKESAAPETARAAVARAVEPQGAGQVETPRAAEPQASTARAAEPQAGTPHAGEAQIAEREANATRAEVSKDATSRQESRQADKPEAEAPQTAATQNAAPRVAVPEATEPQVVAPQTAESRAAAPQGAAARPEAPETAAFQALEPDAIEPAEATPGDGSTGTNAIMPHINRAEHKPSLLVRALAFAIRVSNKRK